MFFNLTKGMIGSLLSDQFQNIELDSKLYSLENQYLCFYVSSFIHWWLCIGFLKLSVNPHLGLVFCSSFFWPGGVILEGPHVVSWMVVEESDSGIERQ